MKTTFIPVKKHLPKTNFDSLKKLPNTIVIFYAVQYKELAGQVKKQLSKSHRILSTTQILGCSNPKIPKQAKAILLLIDGKFHSICLYQNKIPVYTFDGLSVSRVSEKEIQRFLNKQKASYLKYLNANNVGVLISTKPGQQNFKKAISLKTKKRQYFFLSNDVNTQEFENFPQIQSWINTACRRIDLDNSSIINMEKINPN